MTTEHLASVEVRLDRLRSSVVTVLTDAHMRAFSALYDEERAREEAAKRHLRAVLDEIDLVGKDVHRTDHEEYRPR